MNLSDLQLGDVVNVVIAPGSLTVKGIVPLVFTGVATIIGTDTVCNDKRTVLVGQTKDEPTPFYRGKMGRPEGGTYLSALHLVPYMYQYWIEPEFVINKVSGVSTSSTVMGATCACGFHNQYWDTTDPYVYQSCKMWEKISK